jgi:hypothetical protein
VDVATWTLTELNRAIRDGTRASCGTRVRDLADRPPRESARCRGGAPNAATAAALRDQPRGWSFARLAVS